jgi:excinuclease ABC subunit B
MEEILVRSQRNERVLVTTLTKRMAEELTGYLLDHDIKTNYIHSEVKTLERVQIINDLRQGVYDVLVGVNLLREGLDLPEVSLVAILDADKEGFLRSHRSLTQTAGRAARNVNGKVIMYADTITASMQLTIDETRRLREKQIRYNEEHHITPKQIVKNISTVALQKENRPDVKELRRVMLPGDQTAMTAADPIVERMTRPQLEKSIAETTRLMKEAAKALDFLQAAQYRDEIDRLQKELELK